MLAYMNEEAYTERRSQRTYDLFQQKPSVPLEEG